MNSLDTPILDAASKEGITSYYENDSNYHLIICDKSKINMENFRSLIDKYTSIAEGNAERSMLFTPDSNIDYQEYLDNLNSSVINNPIASYLAKLKDNVFKKEADAELINIHKESESSIPEYSDIISEKQNHFNTEIIVENETIVESEYSEVYTQDDNEKYLVIRPHGYFHMGKNYLSMDSSREFIKTDYLIDNDIIIEHKLSSDKYDIYMASELFKNGNLDVFKSHMFSADKSGSYPPDIEDARYECTKLANKRYFENFQAVLKKSYQDTLYEFEYSPLNILYTSYFIIHKNYQITRYAKYDINHCLTFVANNMEEGFIFKDKINPNYKSFHKEDIFGLDQDNHLSKILFDSMLEEAEMYGYTLDHIKMKPKSWRYDINKYNTYLYAIFVFKYK